MKELIVYNNNGKKSIMLVQDEVLIEKYDENEKNKTIEGNIYIGKVQNVFQGMQAAFINVGKNKNAFIHLKDILPKQDITKNESYSPTENIKDLIKPGDPILVEIKRDSTSKKGPRVSTHISLTGRFIVLLPNSPFITISQKIIDKSERERLTNIVKKYLPENMGAIIRTVSENADELFIKKDIDRMVKKWENIINIDIEEYPKEIYNVGGILIKILTDLIDSDLERIVVNTEEDYKIVNQYLQDSDVNITLLKKEDILQMYSLETQLERAENRKIWLKSGGFITIDKTEALTAIDVNSGKYVGETNLESTAYQVNKEASIEIAKQLRLRDIGGIVIIDFIDMHKQENKQKIIDQMIESTKNDRSRVQIEGFTKLNLMELTRKHICSNNM